MQARYYDPVIGRFLSSDPMGFAGGGPAYFPRYTYVANDPVNLVDPNGTQAEEALKDFVRGAGSVPNAYRVLAMHGVNRVGTPSQRAQAARIEGVIGLAATIIRNDPWEAGEAFGMAMNQQGLAYLGGRTAAQSAITYYSIRRLGAKSNAGKVAATIGVGAVNFTASQAGSVLDGFYGLDNQLQESGFNVGDLSAEAVTTALAPLAAGSSINFDQNSGTVSLVTKVTETGSRISKEVKTYVCTFSGGTCK
ncbi:MAG: RHS repeat-associated core domain-containing protein [Pseudomonadota bacterium]